jgi:hypothetical protein
MRFVLVFPSRFPNLAFKLEAGRTSAARPNRPDFDKHVPSPKQQVKRGIDSIKATIRQRFWCRAWTNLRFLLPKNVVRNFDTIKVRSCGERPFIRGWKEGMQLMDTGPAESTG